MLERFWSKYLSDKHKRQVRSPFEMWPLRRTQAFVDAASKRRAEHPPADVDAELRLAGWDPRLKARQFRRFVGTRRTLFEVVGVRWVGEVDWAHWQASARARGDPSDRRGVPRRRA